VLQRAGRPISQPGAVGHLAAGALAAKLGPQLLGSAHDQGLELVDGASARGHCSLAGGQQHPQGLPIPAPPRHRRALLGQRLPGSADGVQGVGLAAAAGRPAGPVDLDHPLTTVGQQPRQPGAIGAGAFDREASPAGNMRAGEVEQLLKASRVGGHDQLPEQAADRRDGGRG
jgi:hypothetical protein